MASLFAWEARVRGPLSHNQMSITNGIFLVFLWPFFLSSHRIYCLTDNLSKTLQKERMSALSGQRLANLTVETLEGMRTSESFDLFFESVKKKATKLEVEEPTLPRKCCRSKFVRGHEEKAQNTEAFYPQSSVTSTELYSLMQSTA